MAGLGVEKLDKLMPDVVQTASKVDIASHVRDGYIMMFIYLPLTFGDKFTPYVGPIIPCILKVCPPYSGDPMIPPPPTRSNAKQRPQTP